MTNKKTRELAIDIIEDAIRWTESWELSANNYIEEKEAADDLVAYQYILKVLKKEKIKC